MGSYRGEVELDDRDAVLGIRLDRYVADRLGLLSRSQLKQRLGNALLNGREVKASRILKAGDLLELDWADEAPDYLVPENIPLKIIYEDDDVCVINKPSGLVVHPGAGNHRSTVANALLYHRQERGLPDLQDGGLRTGIVHRLDKATSGVLITAYNDRALAFLSGEFKQRRVRKIYAALVRGSPPEHQGKIEGFLKRDRGNRKKFAVSSEAGKYALTEYRVIRSFRGYSLLKILPHTGRTHQIRVHLRSLRCPILGDPLYGEMDPRFPRSRLMLHAHSLSITLPSDLKRHRFSAPLPKEFLDTLKKIEGLP